MSSSIKVYVINLKRALDRKLFMTKQLQKTGLDFEFIEAIDSKEIDDKYLDDTNDGRSWPDNLSRAELACTLSHIKACDTMVKDNNYGHGLIIEDDIIISNKIESIIDQVIDKKLPGELILFFSIISRPVQFNRTHSLDSGYSIVSANNFDGIWGAQAYLASRDNAFEMSKSLLPIQTVADDWKTYLDKKIFSDVKLVYPFPILHAELLSIINEKNPGINPRTRLKNFIYRNRIFPFYNIFLWYRRYCAEKIQRKNIDAPEFSNRKTYKL